MSALVKELGRQHKATDALVHSLLWELAIELNCTGHRPGELLEAALELEDDLVGRRGETWRQRKAPWREP